MKRTSNFGPAHADRGESQASEGFCVSSPDEQGNRFITVLDDDGIPLPPNEPTNYDREGA